MNEVYVITGITDPFEDKREVLAVVDSKEQAELAECYYNNICNDIEVKRSEIVHFDADKIYYKIWFRMKLCYTEKGLRYNILEYYSCHKVYGSYQKFFNIQYNSIPCEDMKAKYLILGYFTAEKEPATKRKQIKLIIDFINDNLTEFTEKYGKIERMSLEAD